MNFDDIVEELSEFPKLPKSTANDWLLEALQDFCQETWVLTEVIAFLTTAGTYEHTLTPITTDTRVIGIPHDGCQWATVYTPIVTADDSSDAGTLTAGTDYTYQVTAYSDDYGETLPCAVVTQEAPAGGAIDLDWSAVDDADGYRIYGNNGSGTTYTRMTSQTTVDYTDDGTDTPDAVTEPPTKSELMKPIALTNIMSENQMYEHWRGIESDNIDRILYDGDKTIRLNAIPETSNIGFQVKVALYPEAEITIPTILEQYKKAFKDYVRMKIYLHPETKTWVWHDKEMGRYHLSQYRQKRLQVKSRTMFGFGGEVRARYQFFA